MTPKELAKLSQTVVKILDVDEDPEPAVSLLTFTGVIESRGVYAAQEHGPALGLFQMEEATYNDIWENFLQSRPELFHNTSMLGIVKFVDKRQPEFGQLFGNAYLACAMARVHYLRVPDPLPAKNAWMEIVKYWKTHYNTDKGKGTIQEGINHLGRAQDAVRGLRWT